MKILVDADACPNVIKEILYRASNRLKVPLVFFANHPLQLPRSPLIRMIQVTKGFDVADNEIEQMVEPNDIVITADIPLADQVIDKHAYAINPRGTLYTKENIKERLRIRNMMSEIRDSGVMTGGPAALGNKDKQNFANALDALLARLLRK